MYCTIHANARPPRLGVISYDIASERRARHVRKLLKAIHHDKQYSVFEAMLKGSEYKGLLAEISSLCDMAEDLLSMWWPLDNLRLHWQEGRLHTRSSAGRHHDVRSGAALWKGTGNFVVCYDVSDPDALHAVAHIIATEAAMIQRSVYWLRINADQLINLFRRCACHLAETDRLWAYPLRGADDLWRIGQADSSILPIASHRWPWSPS